MENRSIANEHRKELALHQHAAATRPGSIDDLGEAPLSREELHLLIEFFRLLDHWDKQEVVQ